MKIDIATLFPEMCESFLSESVVGRARTPSATGTAPVEINCFNIRDYAGNRHNRVDDKAYGGGIGMVIRAEPVYACVTDIIRKGLKSPPKLIYMSPQGRTLTQGFVKELAREEWLVILCGHYEGVDCRVTEELGFTEISVGDYVVTGGELPALILTDAVTRLQKGVLPDDSAFTDDSHWNGALEHPLYTRPEIWRGRSVPGILLSGHHGNIARWKEEEAAKVTGLKRPDLLSK
ncbi:MAG: tRNA (guanosine(37)-N1)-methyltransferase TrmD [Oscillospiraceae bacterium]|jgi:tRNA (guanine37-N1)-methyltransferase|nr:tRNA (guanosine(37)-N1)-methyltransferase TrmD [Oscillospiraceae bacterium]